MRGLLRNPRFACVVYQFYGVSVVSSMSMTLVPSIWNFRGVANQVSSSISSAMSPFLGRLCQSTSMDPTTNYIFQWGGWYSVGNVAFGPVTEGESASAFAPRKLAVRMRNEPQEARAVVHGPCSAGQRRIVNDVGCAGLRPSAFVFARQLYLIHMRGLRY